MPSIKQIGTICFLSIISISPTFADNEPTTPTLIPSSEPGCNQAVLNTTEGSAALEAIYTPNTIGTTWYSNGAQLTGNDIPETCTYGTTLVPPTPEARPGYAFDGWTLRVPDVVDCSGLEPLSCYDTEGCVKITDSSCRTVVSSCAGVDNQESCENSGTRGEMFCICGWNGSSCVSVDCEPGF